MMDVKDFNEQWSDKHIKFISYGPEIRNDLMANWCEEMILKAKPAYYKGTPIMEDAVFDKFEDSLKLLRPQSKVLQKVGFDLGSPPLPKLGLPPL